MIRFEIKLLLVFVIFFIGVVGLMLFLTMRAEKKLIDEVEKDLQDFVRTVHFSTRKLSMERGPDREALERFIEEAKKNKAVREVSVVGSTQEVIASSNPKKVGERREGLSGQEIVVREQFGEKESSGQKKRYEVRIPLIRNDRVIGLVQSSLVTEDYRYLLRQLYLENLMIAAGVMLFAFGAVFFILNRMNRPLRSLTLAAGRVAAGDLTTTLISNGDDEVVRLTNAFNVMTQKLAEQKKLEDKLHSLERREILAEMASSLAHEIRNPLNLINLTADHLSQQFQPEAGERQQAYQDLISGLKTEVRQLNRMVTDFLNIGRPVKLKKNRVSCADFFDQIQRSIQHQLNSKEITLKFSGLKDLWMMVDQEQMRLVFLNLFLNAIEAVPNSGSIVVHGENRDSSGEIFISVTDNGSGIPSEDLHRIFEPYFTKRQEGTGLGLALVKRIIEEHDGTIKAANASGGGARFEITLPMEG